MSAVETVGLVLGILALIGLLLVGIFSMLRRKMRDLALQLESELSTAGEELLRGPEEAIYRGATAEFGRVKGNGLIALTKQRLAFRKVVGQPVDVLCSRITGVREDRCFIGAARGGQTHLIVQLQGDTELGFYVRDREGWKSALLDMMAPG